MTETTVNPETGTGGEAEAALAERFSALLAADEKSPPSEAPGKEKEEAEGQPEPADTEPEETEGDAPDPEQEEAEEQEPEASADSEPAFEVKGHGRVKASELVAGYMKEQDYRAKTTKLAEDARAIQAEREHYLQVISQVEDKLGSNLESEFGNIDWEKLYDEDPFEATRLRGKYELKREALQKAKEDRERVQQIYEAENTRKLQQYALEQWSKTADIVPEFKNPKTAEKLHGEVQNYLQGQGFTQEDLNVLNTITDYRVRAMFVKAMRYDRAQSGAKDLSEKLKQPAQKFAKPGAAGTQRGNTRQELSAKLRKSGSINDLAAIFARELAR